MSDLNIETKEDLVADGLPVPKPPKTVKVGRVGNIVEQEPVATSFVASVIVFLAAKYGFDTDYATATYAAGGVLAVLSFLARQLAVPLKRAEAGIASAYKADPAYDAKPVL